MSCNLSSYDPVPCEPTPEPMATNGMRSIRIDQLHNGYIVAVGCHSFAFETKESMMVKLTQYINDPQATEEKWHKKELFK